MKPYAPYKHPTEPDAVDFDYSGFPCMIRRAWAGHLCGYVFVPPGHPWHGQEPQAEVHGGVTWDSLAEKHDTANAEERGLHGWWLVGFDCGHAGDVRPGDSAYYRDQVGGVYRDLAYVRAEVESLVEQARAAAGPCSSLGEIATCEE